MQSGSAARTLYGRTASWPGSAPLASVVSAGVGQIALFASGVAAARILGPTDRGTLATVALVLAIAVSAGSLGLPLALTYDLAREPDHARSLTRWALRILFAQALLLAPLAALGIALLARRDDILATILLGAAVTPAVLGQMYGLAILQGRQRFALLNLARVVPAALYAVLASVLLVAGVGSLASVTACFFVANAVAAAVMLIPAVRTTGLAGEVEGRRLVGFGLRAWLGSMSPMDTFRFDQIVVVVFFAPAVVGTYVVALAFSNLPRLIGMSIGLVAYPRIAAMRTRDRLRRSVFQYTLITLIVAAPFVLAILIAARPIIDLFFGDRYSSSADLVGLLVAAGWLGGGRRTMSEAARGAGLAAAGSVAELAAWMGFAVAAGLLVPADHERGIAAAMLVGSGVGLATMVGLVLRSLEPVPGGEDLLGLKVR
jgi:O-antigen/teichoic acid export membrane protein